MRDVSLVQLATALLSNMIGLAVVGQIRPLDERATPEGLSDFTHFPQARNMEEAFVSVQNGALELDYGGARNPVASSTIPRRLRW